MAESQDRSRRDKARRERANRERASGESASQERAVRDADRLVGQLMDQAYRTLDVREFKIDTSDIEDDMVFSDLEHDAAEFSQDLEILRQYELSAPAIQIGREDFIPMSLETFVGESLPGEVVKSVRNDGARSPFRDNFRDAFRHELNIGAQQGVVLLDQNEARSTFARRAVDFLATRIKAVRDFRERGGRGDWLGPYSFLKIPQSSDKEPVDTLACYFTVSTDTNNLSVQVSGAYSLSFRHFKDPTSPVSDYLLSGTYIFGVIGGPYKKRVYDPNIVVVLPGTPSVHLYY